MQLHVVVVKLSTLDGAVDSFCVSSYLIRLLFSFRSSHKIISHHTNLKDSLTSFVLSVRLTGSIDRSVVIPVTDQHVSQVG